MSRLSVTSFGPVLMAAWEKATSPDGLEVNCGPAEAGRKKATHLRYRLYMLRTAMKKEAHPLFEAAHRVSLSITQNGNDFILRGEAADADLEQLLINSGVSPPDAPELPDLNLDQPATESEET